MNAVEPKVVETEKYIFRVYNENHFLEYTVKEGVTVGVEDVLAGKRLIESISPGIKFYVLAQGINFFTITADARRLSATKEFADNTVAIAFFTTNMSILLLGEMYNKISKPAVLTKIFNNKDNALEWLSLQMHQEGKVLPY
ncbi:MAG: hypothetical protein V4608_04735 [Bacteroidota bacterium]